MLRYVISLLLVMMSACTFATPYDGVYKIQPVRIVGSLIAEGFRDLDDSYLTIQEQEDGSVILLILNSGSNDWQAYISPGSPVGNEYVFVGAYNQSFYSESITSEEITITFIESGDVAGDGLISHTLIPRSDSTFPQSVMSENGTIEIRRDEILIKQ